MHDPKQVWNETDDTLKQHVDDTIMVSDWIDVCMR